MFGQQVGVNKTTSSPTTPGPGRSPCMASCTLCGAPFASRNLLFAHLREAHGLAPVAPAPAERVALVIAYLGQDYFGSCANGEKEESRYPTIEGTLCRCIGVSTSGISRCARTDRGVHSLHSVVSLVLPPLAPEDLSAEDWVVALNKRLPDSILCLRRLSVLRDFDAHRMCDRRRYEYVLPYSALRRASSHDPDDEPPISIRRRLKHVLKEFVGAHDFSRFTRHSGSYLEAHDPWRQMFRIYAVGSLPSPEAGHDESLVVVSISGRSFLQEQIRKMMGGVVGVMRGSLPPTWIADALAQPAEGSSSPTAPAFPLYLAGASFAPYLRRCCQRKTNEQGRVAAAAEGRKLPLDESEEVLSMTTPTSLPPSEDDPGAALQSELQSDACCSLGRLRRQLHAGIRGGFESGVFERWLARQDEEQWGRLTARVSPSCFCPLAE
jgi:tRNA pseudouridine(38-40) synthase